MLIYNLKALLSLGLVLCIVGAFSAFGLAPVGLVIGGTAAIAVDLFLRVSSRGVVDGLLVHPRAGGHVWFVPAWIVGGGITLLGIGSTIFTIQQMASAPPARGTDTPLVRSAIDAWERSHDPKNLAPPRNIPLANLGYALNLEGCRYLESELTRLLKQDPDDPPENLALIQELRALTIARKSALEKFLKSETSAERDAHQKLNDETVELIRAMPGGQEAVERSKHSH